MRVNSFWWYLLLEVVIFIIFGEGWLNCSVVLLRCVISFLVFCRIIVLAVRFYLFLGLYVKVVSVCLEVTKLSLWYMLLVGCRLRIDLYFVSSFWCVLLWFIRVWYFVIWLESFMWIGVLFRNVFLFFIVVKKLLLIGLIIMFNIGLLFVIKFMFM